MGCKESGFSMDCRAIALLAALLSPAAALAQSCPASLSDAKRLVLVTTESMDATPATAQLFERASVGDRWRALGPPEPALVGRAGMAWAPMFRHLARAGEPIKAEGDKRAPAGVYPIGQSFGTVPSARVGHLPVTDDTVCVDDLESPAYNTITLRSVIGPSVHAENMSKALPMYRRGLLVDYPTDAAAKAGSCIFIHVWRSPTRGTGGCVSMPEERILALQEFAEAGTVLAILPRHALSRLRGCLPQTLTVKR
jgi:L,D-peptidoglycan transpeptidase YkuD (ErfK/YbiS/YcfS/YnhG family)